MITKLTHTAVYVINQEEAYDFYVNKLGFKVIMDVPMGAGARWLTVSPKEQDSIEINLFPLIEGQVFNKETLKTMKELCKRERSEQQYLNATIYMLRMKNLKAKV